MGCVFLHSSPAEDAPENLVNVTLTSQQSTEPSLNDFQDFVVDMQKTITSLRKQVRAVVYCTQATSAGFVRHDLSVTPISFWLLSTHSNSNNGYFWDSDLSTYFPPSFTLQVQTCSAQALTGRTHTEPCRIQTLFQYYY